MVKSFHPAGGLLWHRVRIVQHRGAMWSQQAYLLVVLRQVPCALLYQKWNLSTMEFGNTASMMQISVWIPLWSSRTPCPAAEWNHSLPLPLHCCRPAGEGEEHCDFHHLSRAPRCNTSRIQNTPEQGDRAQMYHIARSCQPAGPEIEVLPEVLIQTSLSDISAFLLMPEDYTLVTSK